MTQPVDFHIVKPFIEATVTTLKVQCQVDAVQGKSFLKGTQPNPATDIAGIIGITSTGFNGSISVCFPEATFLAVMGGMLGETYTTMTKDLEDGAGELTNIIFGFGKRVLSEKGHQFQKALPSVVRGGGLQVRHLSPGPTIVVPFQTAGGPFYIEIAIEPVAQAS